MTPVTTHMKAIENVLRRRGIDLYDQDLRGFMDLGGAVDDHLWKEIYEERERLEAAPAISMKAVPWWREHMAVPVYSVFLYALVYASLLWVAYK